MSTFDICCVHNVNRPFAPDWYPFHVPFDGRLFMTVDELSYKSGNWQNRVASHRTKLLQKVTTQYWVSLDDDVQVDKENLDLALEYAWNHPSLGCVGIPCLPPERGGARSGTVHMACAVWQTAATDGLMFTTGPEGGKACECLWFNRAIIERGWGVEYHPTAVATHWEG